MRFHRHSFRRNLSFLLNPIPSDREILFFFFVECFTKIKSHKAFFFVYHRRHHHRLCLVRIFILLLLLVWLLIWDIVFHMNLAFYVLLLLFCMIKSRNSNHFISSCLMFLLRCLLVLTMMFFVSLFILKLVFVVPFSLTNTCAS